MWGHARPTQTTSNNTLSATKHNASKMNNTTEWLAPLFRQQVFGRCRLLRMSEGCSGKTNNLNKSQGGEWETRKVAKTRNVHPGKHNLKTRKVSNTRSVHPRKPNSKSRKLDKSRKLEMHTPGNRTRKLEKSKNSKSRKTRKLKKSRKLEKSKTFWVFDFLNSGLTFWVFEFLSVNARAPVSSIAALRRT